MSDAEELFTCPSCGFLMFPEPPGSYDICSLCNWEDDSVQLRFPSMRGGANGYCLYESQQEALQQYPLDMTRFGEYTRDPQWRPVTREDCLDTSGMPRSGMEYFNAVGEEGDDWIPYWKRGKP